MNARSLRRPWAPTASVGPASVRHHLQDRACLLAAVQEASASPNAVCSSRDLQEERQVLERAYSSQDACTSSQSATVAACQQLLIPAADAPTSLVWGAPLQVVSGGPEPPKRKDRHEKHDDYYANVGDAIRTLRDDYPRLFETDLNYDIYREDIVFCDPRNEFHGMKKYKTIFWSLRFHGNLFFKQLFVEVKRIWQKDDDKICVRWTVHGLPRLPFNQIGIFDGISTYKLDSHGKIYEHKVDNTIMSDPPLARLPYLASLDLSVLRGKERQPFPTPFTAEQQCSDDCMRTPPDAA